MRNERGLDHREMKWRREMICEVKIKRVFIPIPTINFKYKESNATFQNLEVFLKHDSKNFIH